MKHHLIALALLAFAPCIHAGTVRFTEHNFSIDVPDGWSDIKPQPPQVVLGVQNADNSKRVLAFATQLPANERKSGAADVRAGAKRSIAEQGWQIDPEKEATIGSLTFVSFTAHAKAGQTFTAYVSSAGDTVYMLQAAVASAEMLNDADVQSAIQSFRLLTPAQQQPLNSPSTSFAFRAGKLSGYLLFPCLLVWLLVRAFSRKN